MRIEDTDDDDSGEEGEGEEEEELSVSSVPAASSVCHTILTSRAKQQQNRRSSKATLGAISANSSLLCDFTAKDIDMTSDASTVDFDMSEDSTETLESHLLPSGDISVPRSMKQSASQPVPCIERERNLSRKIAGYSTSVVEVEEFSDITNITNSVLSPTEGGHSSPEKGASARRSIVDLTQKTG